MHTSVSNEQSIINDLKQAEQTVLCVSPGIIQITQLETLLGCRVVFAKRPSERLLKEQNIGAMLAWGNKPSAAKAKSIAAQLQLPVLHLEDGFLRSVGLGANEQPYSLVLDDEGIYYDARSPSRVERLIQEPLLGEQRIRADKLIQLWRSSRVSKYNHSPELKLTDEPYVLVVDQTFGDASIEYGLADAARFIEMLREAIERFPDDTIYVKTHPDVVAGLKQGHFSQVPAELEGRFCLLGEDIHAPALLEHAQAVFCVTSQMGFEALLWGKPVFVFGMPFYAGWGLTEDYLERPERRTSASLQQLVYAALVAYPRYLHPESQQLCQAEDLLLWMAEQRRQRDRFAGPMLALDWPRWKRPVLRKFLQGGSLTFVRGNQVQKALQRKAKDVRTVGWGAKAQTDLRVEDGFVRSVGLGADLTLPQSWVIDDLGMYYDASRPSRLEALLKETCFDDEMRARGQAIRSLLLASKVTKYNVGRRDWQRPGYSSRVILVPGQVESDASIKLGSPEIKTNLGLLKAVRENYPQDYVVYKPHPDVQAGLRTAGSDKDHASFYCDEIILDQDMAWLLEQVDAVNTLTSLTGFEALLRGVDVACYGQPFYAGWGLTDDKLPPERRQRALTVDELVYATLVLYPVYVNYQTGRYSTVEGVIQQISQARQGDSKPSLLTRLKRRARVFKRF